MKTIVVATDLSPAGNNAVRFATNFAKATGSSLVVFHSALLPPFNPMISEAEFLQLERDTLKDQQIKLEFLVSAIYREEGFRRNKGKLTILTRIGPSPTETITQVISEQHADLLVVGTHGATGLKWFGSTTCDLIFKAGTMVMAIPPEYKFRQIRAMVYASDLNNLVNELRSIVVIAKPMKAAIQVFHLNARAGTGNPVPDKALLTAQIKYERIRVIIQNRAKGKTIHEELQEYLQKTKSDLLVMFPEERSVFTKLFARSKTAQFAYDAKMPLLTCLKSGVK